MRRIISFVAALVISAGSIADINSPEIQQALHNVVSAEDGVASNHIFVCGDRNIRSIAMVCDQANNIVVLNVYIDNQNQLDTDFSVFTHLEQYRLIAETNLSQLPQGLTNLAALSKVTFYADGVTIPEIDGNNFPTSLNTLVVHTSHSVSLKNWGTHELKTLNVSGSEINFNNTPLTHLNSLNLGSSPSVINEDFTSFVKVTSFSWQHMLETNLVVYNATRIQFPLLSDEMVEINLNRRYNEPQLTKIPAYILQLPNLQSLKITGHAITEIPAQLFSMPGLKHLDVSNNNISDLPAISTNTSLEYLALNSNKEITKIPSAVFQLTALKYLDVSSNSISSLPAELFLMANLEELVATHNVIENITVTGTKSALQTLLLRSNKLSHIPAELLNLENLLTLDLRFNEITTLPDITSGRASLQTLDISNNKISSIPVSVFNHLPLQDLQASKNQLSGLPIGIVNSSLKNIMLAGNSFTTIPDELSAFTGLKSADFTENKIETFGEQWKQSPSLEKLSVAKNQLRELTATMLNNLPISLSSLSLEMNQMVGELPAFTKSNPELSLNIANNALWSTDKNILLQYSQSAVLAYQLLPARGLRVIEKHVDGGLISYIQWGFPLMDDIKGRTAGTHAQNYSGPTDFSNVPYRDVNPGPKISTGYTLVIEYTQGKKAGQTETEKFSCVGLFGVALCNLKNFSASYDTNTYNSSVFSYAVEGSLAGANITVYSTTFANASLQSSPTYWGSNEKHEQFVDELEYDEAILPSPKVGSIYYYHLFVLLGIALIRRLLKIRIKG